MDWDLHQGEGVEITPPVADSNWQGCGVVRLTAEVKSEAFLEQGWSVTEGFSVANVYHVTPQGPARLQARRT